MSNEHKYKIDIIKNGFGEERYRPMMCLKGGVGQWIPVVQRRGALDFFLTIEEAKEAIQQHHHRVLCEDFKVISSVDFIPSDKQEAK